MRCFNDLSKKGENKQDTNIEENNAINLAQPK
jgi:hypothetical protein